MARYKQKIENREITLDELVKTNIWKKDNCDLLYKAENNIWVAKKMEMLYISFVSFDEEKKEKEPKPRNIWDSFDSY